MNAMYTLVRTTRLRALEAAVQTERAAAFAARRAEQAERERAHDAIDARRSAEGLLRTLLRAALRLPPTRDPQAQARIDRIAASCASAQQADGSDGAPEGPTLTGSDADREVH